MPNSLNFKHQLHNKGLNPCPCASTSKINGSPFSVSSVHVQRTRTLPPLRWSRRSTNQKHYVRCHPKRRPPAQGTYSQAICIAIKVSLSRHLPSRLCLRLAAADHTTCVGDWTAPLSSLLHYLLLEIHHHSAANRPTSSRLLGGASRLAQVFSISRRRLVCKLVCANFLCMPSRSWAPGRSQSRNENES